MSDEVLTVKEASQFLNVPQSTLNYLIATNQVPYSRIGERCVRFTKERLQTYLKDREGIPYHRPAKGQGKSGE